jgi:outer membrane receptor for ferrienterochelin and colicin
MFLSKLSKRNISSKIKAGVFLACWAGISSAYAQGSNVLEEIVVTARGIEESVRDIPVAITVLSEERLNNLSLTTFEDIASSTPGVDLIRSVSGSGAVINMRGIASNGNSIGIAQSVSTIMDGVYTKTEESLTRAHLMLSRWPYSRGLRRYILVRMRPPV